MDIKKPRLSKTVKKWVELINSGGSPAEITQLYSDNAVLLATYSSFLQGHQEIYKYFVDFLDKPNLKCKMSLPATCLVDKNTKTEIRNGLYEFSFDGPGGRESVNARYTFCISNNQIITHHSSINP